MPNNASTRHRRWKRAVLLTGTLLLAGAVVAIVWFVRSMHRGPTYTTQPARTADITQTISANGTLNPVTLVNVGTQVSGTVQILRADFNDHVAKGQVLLELDPTVLRAVVRQDEGGLASSEAALALARANEARARPLHAKSYISRQDYEQLVDTVHAARAAVEHDRGLLDQARTNLQYSVIRSPISGVVINRAVDVGQTVAASFQTPTLFQIAKDLRDMQIDSSFAEADIGQIHAGQPVTFTVDAFPDRIYKAAVRQVRLNPTSSQNVVTYDVVVGVRNADETLMPGMTAYVNVIVAQKRHVLAVPAAALRFHPAGATPVAGGAMVYVLEGGALQPRRVVTGISDGKSVQIVSGELRAGDPVVTGQAVQGASRQSASGIHLRAF